MIKLAKLNAAYDAGKGEAGISRMNSELSRR